MNKTELIKNLEFEVEQNKIQSLNYERHHKACIDLIHTMPDDIDLPKLSGYAGETVVIDFDYPTHAQRVAIMQALGAGKWNKEINEYDASMTYTTQYSGNTIRLYGTPLLPCCQVIETIENVPATTRKVRRVVCPQPLPETIEEEATI